VRTKKGIITLTKHTQPLDRPGQAGDVGVYGKRGVYVPDGMTAAEIMIGASAIEKKFGIEHYEARSIVRDVIAAIKTLRGDS
jgi:hypothetical protein